SGWLKGGGVGRGDGCWHQKPDDQKADAEVTENAHVVPLPHPRKLARKTPIVNTLRRQKTALCPPAASRLGLSRNWTPAFRKGQYRAKARACLFLRMTNHEPVAPANPHCGWVRCVLLRLWVPHCIHRAAKSVAGRNDQAQPPKQSRY